MIAYVSGTLAEKKPTHALIDVGGLGYFVHIPISTYESLPDVGAPAKLHTVFSVREDAQQLYGFGSEAERTLFEALTSVSGIGPKLAIAALSATRPADLRDRILSGDAAQLTSIRGVGRKTAERLVVELRDKMSALDLGAGSALGGGGDAKAEARADALSALETLGIPRATAERNLRKAIRANPAAQSADELIRLALREG
jgi:Holliday junction DNA helicase RuvA